MAKSTNSKPKGSAHIEAMLSKFDVSGIVPGITQTVRPEERKVTEADVLWVEPDYVLDSPFQHQEQIDSEQFERLVESIRTNGFFTALFVNIDPQQDGYYFLTAGGHQRREAAKVAGVKVPIYIEPPVDRLTLALRAANENIIGVNRSVVNLGYLFKQMLEEFHESHKLTQEKLAQTLGQTRSWVAARIFAANLDSDLQEMLARTQGERGMRAAFALRRLTRQERVPVIADFLDGEFTTDMVERRVKEIEAARTELAPPSPLPLEQDKAPSRSEFISEARNGTAPSPAASILSHEVQPVAAVGTSPSVTRRLASGGSIAPQAPQEGPMALQVTPAKDPAPVAAHSTQQAFPPKSTAIRAREAKLQDLLTRLKAYQQLRGRETPSDDEGSYLLQIAHLLEGLLPSSASHPTT